MPSVYKGDIDAGKITATWKADAANADSDLLRINYSPIGGTKPATDHEAVAPGGSGTVEVKAPKDGVLEVWIDLGPASDKGHLTVAVDGTTVDAEAVEGSVVWTYTVVK